jgi:hypothetical protein
MPATKETVLNRIKSKIPDFMSFDETSYIAYDKPAKFIDTEYGEFWASPKNVCKGTKHKQRGYKERKVANKLTAKQVSQDLPPHLKMDESTYIDTKHKAKFIDREFGEFWAVPNFIRNGGNHPERSKQSTIQAHTYSMDYIKSKFPDFIILKSPLEFTMTTKCIFIDVEFGEFQSTPSYILNGHYHPKRGEIARKEKWHSTSRESGFVQLLSDGRSVSQVAKNMGLSSTHGLKVFQNHGERLFLEWCEKAQYGSTSLELYTNEILQSMGLGNCRFQKQLRDGETVFKPDFKLKENLYLNVDGLYWHSEKKGKIDYHIKLREFIEKSNARIIQFYEEEILYKTPIVKSIIQNIFGQSQRLFARKLQLKVLKKKEACDFLTENHLMGPGANASYIGLIDKDQNIYALVSYKKIPRNGIEIVRFCVRNGYSVVGGLNKLISYIEKYKPGYLLSWVDLRYATGNGFKVIGFEAKEIVPSWRWTDGQNTYNRLQCRANMDDRKLTEKQHAEEKKWYRIYDAGQLKMVKSYVNE